MFRPSLGQTHWYQKNQERPIWRQHELVYFFEKSTIQVLKLKTTSEAKLETDSGKKVEVFVFREKKIFRGKLFLTFKAN